MTRANLPSDWALTILNMLCERPMHPYEMRRLIKFRGKDQLLDLRPGSLYVTIDQLLRRGLIEAAETSRAGNFPERTVYRLTTAGRDTLTEWMSDLLSTPQPKDHPRFLAALNYLPALGPADVARLLARRVLALEGTIAAMEAQQEHVAKVELPRLFIVEHEYVLDMLKAELRFVRGLLDDLEHGRLTWDSEWLQQMVERFDMPLEDVPMRE